jgi:adenylosuccinate lyase
MTDFNQYLSPFSWRYGSQEMRSIWSEIHKRRTWRRIWAALASCQAPYGLVTTEQAAELESHVSDVDIEQSLKIEARIHHDLMAELKVFAEQCPSAGGIIHLGATSMDIEDNADALRMREAFALLLPGLETLLRTIAEKIEKYASLPTMAFTHLQPAEPTTLGYRLAAYAQDLLGDHRHLTRTLSEIRGKGFKGAVGTAASYHDLIGAKAFPAFEADLSRELDLPFFEVATQTYPRKQDYVVISALAGLGASLYKLAFDLRFLQSPPIGEWSEPFGVHQVGSSAMPFKRNPINAEKIDSLARALSVMPQIAWNNAGHTLLERTLDDSANRRSLLPEAFLICDELLRTATKIIAGLNVNTAAIQRNLDLYGPFSATERLLMEAVRRGADRQVFHETLRKHAMAAWQEVQEGRPNRLVQFISDDPQISALFAGEKMDAWLNIDSYTGLATERAKSMAARIRNEIPSR